MSSGSFESVPSVPVYLRRADNVPEQAPPFHQRAFDVAVAEQFVRHAITGGRVRDQFADHFGCAGAVLDWHAHFEITRMIPARINALAKNAEASTERRIFAGKTGTGPNVREIENEIVDGIILFFERGRDGQTFASLEKRKDNAASRGRSIFRDQTKLPPGIGGRVGNGRGEIVLQFGTGATNERDRFTLRRIEQRAAVRIDEGGELRRGEIEPRVNRVAANHDLGDFAGREFRDQGETKSIDGRFLRTL